MNERVKRLVVKCKCCAAVLTKRSDAASRNELATAIEACPVVALGPDSTDRTAEAMGVK